MESMRPISGSGRLYPIRYDPDAVFSAGVTARGEQVLIGTHPNFSVATVFFDQQGCLLRNEHRPTPRPAAQAGDDQRALLNQATWKTMEEWKEEMGFSPGVVRVERFFLSHERIGVKDLPDFMHQYLAEAPDEGEELFRPGLYEDIEQFIHKGQFVLCWCGKDFWIDKDGEVTDT